MTQMPLQGLIVADFSRVLAGPLATATLADLGARVIKVERPGTGDDTRSWGPPWTDESSAYFESANRTKESVELDLSDPHDLHLAQRLSARADVLVENFRPGVMDRLGLDYASVQERNRGVVYCSITGFGSAKGAALPGYDFLVQAVGGLMSLTGEREGAPMKVGVALVDVLTSKDAVAGILAALVARGRDGLGQRVEVNLLSSLLAALVNQGASYLTTGEQPPRWGNAHPSIAPYELLRCRDGSVAIACGNNAQFRRLAAVLRAESLADDPRFASNSDRVAHRVALRDELERLLATDGAGRWTELLTQASVPAGEVGDLASAFRLAERLGLEPLVDVGASAPRQVRSPLTLSGTPITDYRRPPRRGEHSDDLRRWLNEEEHE